MTRKRGAEHGRKSTRILLGGNRVCACGCHRKFPRSSSSNGRERIYANEDCNKRANYQKRTAPTICTACGDSIPDVRRAQKRSTCSKECQTSIAKSGNNSAWFGNYGKGNASQKIRAEYCHQSGRECRLYGETIGQGCYTGSCFVAKEPGVERGYSALGLCQQPYRHVGARSAAE